MDSLCKSCNEPFTYAGMPETQMGAVKCPHCGVTLDQDGNVVAAKATRIATGMECRMATRADLFASMAKLPDEIMVMPAGVHQVNASRAGQPVTLTILVD